MTPQEQKQNFDKGLVIFERDGESGVEQWLINEFKFAPASEPLKAETTRCAESFRKFIRERVPTFVDPLPHVPAAMKAVRQWVRWKLEPGSNGRMTKVPHRVDGRKASSTDPDDWTDYETAVTGVEINSNGGVGFMFADGFAGIDLDGCRNPQTGETKPWADEIIDFFSNDVYVEVSPSGTGLHIFVLGKVPGNDKKFGLNTAIGFGKAAIEIYDSRRYFTVTGDAYFEEAGDVLPCDLTEVYKKFHEIRTANLVPRNEKVSAADAAGSNGGVQIELLGTFTTSKFDIFTRGTIESTGDHKPFIICDGIGRLTYAGWSEADLAFMNVAAYVLDCDPDKMWDLYEQSPMARSKWLNREASFRDNTIAEAIKSVQANKVQSTGAYDAAPAPVVAPVALAPAEVAPATSETKAETTFTPVAIAILPTSDSMEEKDIPAYNPTIECGFFKEVIDAVCNGTTIPRQFMRNVIQAFVGSYLSDTLRFKNLDCNSSEYAVNIGTTGTSKRLVWNRGIAKMFPSLINAESDSSVKVFDSADSGAGLRDLFFEKPADAPVFLVVDEAASLGNKSAETKNPEIVDTIIELADSTSISRVKAKKSQRAKSAKVHNNARLSMYMCGQTGEVITLAFQGRKKQGIRERLTIEYSPAIEPGDLPDIPIATKLALTDSLVKLKGNPLWKTPISMTDEAKATFDQYWKAQPDDVRKMVRLHKNLLLDIYLRAVSRGENVATLEDVQLCAEHFERDKIIRKVQFKGEIGNKVGLYVERLKTIIETMRQELNGGKPVGWVALSKRDLLTQTHAYDENEVEFFDRAFQAIGKSHLWEVDVAAANRHNYVKYIPAALETETWDLSAGYREFGSKMVVKPNPAPAIPAGTGSAVN